MSEQQQVEFLRNHLEEMGYGVSIEPEVTGGWFADIRWANGMLAQTGTGPTEAEALKAAFIRLGREPLNLPADSEWRSPNAVPLTSED